MDPTTSATSSPGGAPDVVSLSIHGPVGVLDLHVPSGASSIDVATEYSRLARLPAIPVLYTPLGTMLPAGTTLAQSGVGSGSVLVAVPAGDAGRGPGGGRAERRAARWGTRRRLDAGALSVLWFSLATATALLAGWYASRLPDDSTQRTVTLALLGAAALAGVLPLGPLAPQRVQAAPAFVGAAAFALVWDPAPERLPTILGVSALAAAVAAALARSLASEAEEGLRVWMAAGVGFFLLTTGAALLDVEAHAVWAVLLVVAMLASRFVPIIAIDVPDQYLLDLERLAVTAWSARERPAGRRGRIIVPRAAVAAVASSGRRMVTAACAAVLVVAVTSGYLLLRDTGEHVDLVGARLVVGFAGASLLLAARSYRHAAARGLLRAAGVACWVELAVELAGVLGDGAVSALATAAILLAGLLVVVGVALGRGWRSAWWSRQAEVAEGLSGALALGALVVAVGIFRALWN